MQISLCCEPLLLCFQFAVYSWFAFQIFTVLGFGGNAEQSWILTHCATLASNSHHSLVPTSHFVPFAVLNTPQYLNTMDHNLPSFLQEIWHLANNDPGLTELDIYDDDFGDAGAKLLAATLPSNRMLTKLVLSDCGITHEGMAAIASSLCHESSIALLNVSSNDIGDHGAKSMSASLLKGWAPRELNVDYSGITHVGVEFIANGVRHNTSIEVLSLQGNDCGDRGATTIAETFPNNRTLKVLDLEFCSITHEGVEAIADNLCNSSIEYLYLSGNDFGDEGAIALGNILKTRGGQCRLKNLYLRQSEVGNIGVAALSSALKTTGQELKKLDLEENLISDGGVEALADALQDTNCHLEVLRLYLNDVSHIGLKTVCCRLRSNQVLKHISFGLPQDSREEECLVSVTEMLKHNHFIERIDLFGGLGGKRVGSLKCEIEFLLKLNKAGKKMLLQHNPDHVWVEQLAKVGNDLSMMYFFLRQTPALCRHCVRRTDTCKQSRTTK